MDLDSENINMEMLELEMELAAIHPPVQTMIDCRLT